MSRVLKELLHLLKLEAIGEDTFLGRSQDLGWGRVYGGQVLGQALSAAERTVDSTRLAHSLHGYFLRSGDPHQPIEYRVERTRDGRSFSTRRIRAEQAGRPIFFMAASFQVLETGLEHQDERPKVPGPEGLMSFTDLVKQYADLLPEAMSGWAMLNSPIEMRPVKVSDPMNPTPSEPIQHVWLRTKTELPDDPALHRYFLAYASDFFLLDTALQPHGRSYWQGSTRMASIDHSMWFHHDFRLDDWLLYAMDSPCAAGARGLVRGHFYDQSGVLVASVAQEGLMRPTDGN
ncbi:MAG: acyl-CoA thioesterase II [bacterium]|nr:acyl-CoA thioesterase II [bacterium]